MRTVALYIQANQQNPTHCRVPKKFLDLMGCTGEGGKPMVQLSANGAPPVLNIQLVPGKDFEAYRERVPGVASQV
jgi:hypothetical protein